MAEIFPVKIDDYENLASYLDYHFRSSYFYESYLDFFRFWWENNPAFLEGMERGWVLKNDGIIKGFFGIIPTYFQIGGEEIIIFSGTNWHVSKDFRKYSTALFYKRLKVSNDSISFNSTGSKRASAIAKARRYVPVPRLTSGRSILFFDSKNFIKKRIKGGGVLDPLINLGAWALNKFHSNKFKTANKIDTSCVREISEFDSSFDDLWERTKHSYQNTNVRKAHILQWFCFGNSRRPVRAFGYYKDGKLFGYLILMLKKYEANIWVCLDIWIDPQNEGILSELIIKAVTKAKHEGGDAVVFNHFSKEVASTCKSLGMMKLPSRKYEMMRVGPKYRDIIQAQNSYFVVQGDGALE